MTKNKQDWAIIVGIQVYPDAAFIDLGGPENDALAFRKWVVSPKGGNVWAENVSLILSSKYQQPFANAGKAKPTAKRIKDEFKKLKAISDENKSQGRGRKVGRRLYLYFAGHGCAPLDPTSEEALLLTANASSTSLGENIPGKSYADLHLWETYFEEVVLFMDCCREVLHQAPFFPPEIRARNIDEALDGRIFYGFATKWSLKAREKPLNGRVQGLFTTVLLDGLWGAAANTQDGRVTVRSLKNYIYNTWKSYLTLEELAQQPDLRFSPDNEAVEEGFVFTTVPVPTFPVSIEFPAELQGKEVVIHNYDLQIVHRTIITAEPWRVELKQGKYLLDPAEGQSLRFDVIGTGEKHVRF